jgi:preprotein translocase subunit SecG
MLTGLLITLDILVCIALIGVVLLQRSEGGAFGMGGGPTGLITARGAGDLLTRSTWVLFSLFLVISLGLTLLGEHDRATSGLTQKLKLQQINPASMTQPAPPPATGATPPLGAPGPSPLSAPASPFAAPSPQATAAAPAALKPAIAPARQPGRTVKAAKAAATPAEAPAAAAAPSPAQTAPPPPALVAPPPQPAPSAPASPAPQPKTDPNAPVSTGTP